MKSVPDSAREALRRLEAAGYAAYLVGGCVRDSLLGRVPGDWDITTAALPEQVEAVFAGERIIETGLKHGTVTVLLEGLPLEITTFRTETGYSDHRHPDAVAFTPSLKEDLARRDFTVNAMAWRPVETPLIRPSVRTGAPSPQGEGLADPFNGQADLRDKIIRCVGEPEQRFREDALRILRALRFAAQLDFSIDPATAAAARALRETLALVSRERIAVELTKLLCGPAARRILTEYWEILAVPLPELAPMAGFDQRSKYHCYDVLEHSAAAVEAVPPDRILRWAALLHDVAKPACFTLDQLGRGHFYGHAQAGGPMTREILTRLRFDKDTVRRVSALVELHDYPIDPPVEAQGEGTGNREKGTGPVGAVSQGISSGSQIEDLGRHLIGRPQGVEVQSAVGDDKPPLLAGHNSPGDCCGFYRQCGSWADATGNNSTGDRPQGRWRGPADDRAIPCLERTVKKLLARLGEEDFFLLLALKRADSLAHHPDYRGRTAACDRMEALARELLARQEAFSLKDLAVKGSDLLALGIPKGPEIGKILNALLESVLAGELPNEREALLGKATRIK